MNQQHSDALDDYFGALLEEGPAPQAVAKAQTQAVAEPTHIVPMPFAEPNEQERRLALETLLARVAELKEEDMPPTAPLAEPEPVIETMPAVEPMPVVVAPPTPVSQPVKVEPEPEIITQIEVAPAIDGAAQAAEWRNMNTENSFQVLYFEVAGMTFAVPLTHLGGIYQMSKLTSLFGKPAWFAGMLTERERQLYVVDTARWAMPGHLAEEQYQYLVTLGGSNWGLGCHQLKGTALLTREQVKWRVTPGARPWLAGMVKEKMCALLHVDALIGLLEQGKNIDGQQV